MHQILLRRTNSAALSADEALAVVRSYAQARVLGRAGRNLLIACDPCELDALRRQLPGWLAVLQGRPTPVPDTRLHPVSG